MQFLHAEAEIMFEIDLPLKPLSLIESVFKNPFLSSKVLNFGTSEKQLK